MSRRRGWALSVVLAVVMGCGGGSSPTSPGSQPPSTTPPAPQPTPGAHVVTGSLLNAATDDAAAAVASFTVNGTLVGRSESTGAFSVGFPGLGLNRTVVGADGFVSRETGIVAPGANLRLSLIPSSFDLAAFDQMFRHASVGLTRWTSPPGLVLERRVIKFTQVCQQSYETIDETIGDAESDAILRDMRDGYELLTAGRIGGLTSVSMQTSIAGAALTPRQDRKIVVMRGAGLTAATTYWGYACWSTTADGEVTAGFIILDNAFEKGPSPFHRSLRMHELGHTLGCQHVTTGRISVMNQNARTEPNDFDRQAARIATLRPTGNRTPDIDPSAHTATSLAASRAVTWHGAH